MVKFTFKITSDEQIKNEARMGDLLRDVESMFKNEYKPAVVVRRTPVSPEVPGSLEGGFWTFAGIVPNDKAPGGREVLVRHEKPGANQDEILMKHYDDPDSLEDFVRLNRAYQELLPYMQSEGPLTRSHWAGIMRFCGSQDRRFDNWEKENPDEYVTLGKFARYYHYGDGSTDGPKINRQYDPGKPISPGDFLTLAQQMKGRLTALHSHEE